MATVIAKDSVDDSDNLYLSFFLVREGSPAGGGGLLRQGQFVILRFRSIYNVWGSPNTQMLGKTA